MPSLRLLARGTCLQLHMLDGFQGSEDSVLFVMLVAGAQQHFLSHPGRLGTPCVLQHRWKHGNILTFNNQKREKGATALKTKQARNILLVLEISYSRF